MAVFADLTNKVREIDDFILADFVNENEANLQKSLTFKRHLYSTKYWFLAISWANKRRFLLALLRDLKSAWTLTCLLKSIWNCRPKDSVMSTTEKEYYSSFDAVPSDSNRTAQPIEVLVDVMRAERQWFLTLTPNQQYLMLAELVNLSGGPIMWEVQRFAMNIYEEYHNQILMHLEGSTVIGDPIADKAKNVPAHKSSGTGIASAKFDTHHQAGQASKELETHLAAWNNTIKQMRDQLKLEEIEMTFTDGTKSKIWKVNRTKPEAMETVDFIQLLPSTIAMRILSYLPRASFGDYAKVNSYWAYLIEEYKNELNARIKIDADLDRLKEMMVRHDTSLELLGSMQYSSSSLGLASTTPSVKRKFQASVKPSEKSGGAVSFKHLLQKQPQKTFIQRPIGKVSDLSERLKQRGCIDDNLVIWCKTILKEHNRFIIPKKDKIDQGGIITLGQSHFPCRMKMQKLNIPLEHPLIKDPNATFSEKRKKKLSTVAQAAIPESMGFSKRYSLWTKDFSALYPTLKVTSYEFPV